MASSAPASSHNPLEEATRSPTLQKEPLAVQRDEGPMAGSPGRTRTSNPPVNSRLLCQLSYRGSRPNVTPSTVYLSIVRQEVGGPWGAGVCGTQVGFGVTGDLVPAPKMAPVKGAHTTSSVGLC